MRMVLVTWRSALREATANRRGFATQAVAMIANNAVWVAFWLLFFDRIGAVRGWDGDLMLGLLAVLTTSFGIVLGLLANARHLGDEILSARIDAVLALPVAPLPQLLVRKINPSNVGDILFGIALFGIAATPTPLQVLLFLTLSAGAAVLIAAFLVLVGSLAFWAGREDGDVGFHALLVFASYPVDVFSGTGRFLLHSVLPAAFVASVPARMLANPDPGLLAGMAATTAVFAVLAGVVFRRGLRRYTSGGGWSEA